MSTADIAFAVFGGIAILLAWRMRWLTPSAAGIAALYGASLIIWGGWEWILPVLVFFLTSSLLSVWRSRGSGSSSRESTRASIQVLANGGVPWFMVIGFALWPSALWFYGFLGATAAATADTWSTEIGMMSPSQPRDMWTWEPVVAGTSGAVTLHGTLAATVGGMLIGVVGYITLGGLELLVIVACSGFIGAMIDSALGSTVQAKYQQADGKWREERSAHYEAVRGWRWVTNDTVNLACTAAGCGAAILLEGII